MTVRHVPDQVVVKLKRHASRDRAARDLVLKTLPHQAQVDRDFDDAGYAVFDLPPGSDLSKVIRNLEACRIVEFAERNVIDEGTKSR